VRPQGLGQERVTRLHEQMTEQEFKVRNEHPINRRLELQREPLLRTVEMKEGRVMETTEEAEIAEVSA
jgi:hypothetical protein